MKTLQGIRARLRREIYNSWLLGEASCTLKCHDRTGMGLLTRACNCGSISRRSWRRASLGTETWEQRKYHTLKPMTAKRASRSSQDRATVQTACRSWHTHRCGYSMSPSSQAAKSHKDYQLDGMPLHTLWVERRSLAARVKISGPLDLTTMLYSNRMAKRFLLKLIQAPKKMEDLVRLPWCPFSRDTCC